MHGIIFTFLFFYLRRSVRLLHGVFNLLLLEAVQGMHRIYISASPESNFPLCTPNFCFDSISIAFPCSILTDGSPS